MKINIIASNLHTGGAVQVATSFLAELSSIRMEKDNFKIVVSTVVDRSLDSCCKNFDNFNDYIIHDDIGIRSLWSSFIFDLKNICDTKFTIFGPDYYLIKPRISIVGFAQPWIIYPENECYEMISKIDKVIFRTKFFLQKLFFKRANILVVELEHVKKRLVKVLGIDDNRIHVIHNCISSIFLDESMWKGVIVPKTDGFLRLGFLGRNYIHKNTAIFSKIAAFLEQSHGIAARFYVTFTEAEWAACSPEFRAVCINVGPLGVAQCPRFYEALDAVVFPSLLECFSATPLEALAMQKPLFASDRPFNRDICGKHAHYFDPLSPSDAAQAIAKVFGGLGPDQTALQAGREHAIHFSNPKERAEKYLALLMGDTPAT